MTADAGFLQPLRTMSREEFLSNLRRAIKDSLQGLVARVEQSVVEGISLRSCVIDEFQIVQTSLGATQCAVMLQFNASVGREKDTGDLDRLTGTAEAVVDDTGRATFRNIAVAHERGFVPHDVGGGD